MTSLIGHQHQWIPPGQEDISQVGAIVKSTFLFLRPSWYGIHIIVGKSLRVTISKTFGKQNFLALPGFDQKLQLRYLWYCDTRPQWQAFKKIFDVNASLFGSSLCIFEMNCLVMFDQGDHHRRQETKATRRQCRALRNPSACQHLTFELEKHLKIIFRIKYHPKKFQFFICLYATHPRRESIHCFCLSGVLFDVVT